MQRNNDINFQNLINGIKQRNNSQVSEYLKQNNQLALRSDAEGWTPLHFAARYGNYETLEIIINAMDKQNISKACKTITDERQIPLILVDDNPNHKEREKIRSKLEKLSITSTVKNLHDPIQLDIPTNTHSQLSENLSYGYVAATRVSKKISQSLTHPSSNNLDTQNFKMLRNDTNNMQEIYEKQNKSVKTMDANERNIKRLEMTVNTIDEFGIGNCLEFSYLVLAELIKAGINTPVEIFEIANGSHVFVVIGRDPKSDPNDYTKWGPNAVVIDTWAGQVYPADKMPQKLEDFIFYKHKESGTRACITIPFDTIHHKLEIERSIKLTADFFANNTEKQNTYYSQFLSAVSAKLLQLKNEIRDLTSTIPERKIAIEELNQLTNNVKTVYDVEKIERALKNYKNTVALENRANHSEENLEKLRAIISAAYREGIHPFDLAIKNHQNELLLLLLEIEKNSPDQSINEPIHLFNALAEKNKDAFEMLLNYGANPNQSMDGITPLHQAVRLGDFVAVQLLLKKNANPNAADSYGATPLHLAAQLGKTEILELLLKNNQTNPDAMKKNGETSLLVAAQHNYPEAVDLLLKYHAKPDLARTDGSTPIFIAAQYGHANIVNSLLDAKADFSIARYDRSTPLKAASTKKYFDIVSSLKNLGAVLPTPKDTIALQSMQMYGRLYQPAKPATPKPAQPAEPATSAEVNQNPATKKQ